MESFTSSQDLSETVRGMFGAIAGMPVIRWLRDQTVDYWQKSDYKLATLGLTSVVSVYIASKLLDRIVRAQWITANRHVLVTGCDTGFGFALVKRLDALGCHVMAGCLTTAGVERVRAECSPEVRAFILDVTDTESVLRAREIVKQETKELWAVVNNAGVVGALGHADWLSKQDFLATMAVNLLGLIDVTITFLPLLRQSKGRVVNLTSIAGWSGLPLMATYCVSKFGSEGFSDCLRREIRQSGITVHLVEPGYHLTNILDAKNMAENVERSWRRAPNDVKTSYRLTHGENYAKTLSELVASSSNARAAVNVSPVVDALTHAVLGRYPRGRYVVGWDANWVYKPISQCPEWLSDRLIDAFNQWYM